MHFCPPNTTDWSHWHEHGVSECFLETVSSCTAVSVIVVGGALQTLCYRRYAAPVPPYRVPPSAMFRMQIALTLLLALLPLLRLLLMWLLSPPLAGFQLLAAGCYVSSWLLTLPLVWLERRRHLPAYPNRGHGVPLLLTWTLLLAGQAVVIVCVKSAHWWFALRRPADYVQLVLYGLRLTGCLLMFLLGLRAPGIPRVDDFVPYRREREPSPPAVGAAAGGQFPAAQGSTWRQMGGRIRQLFTFVWPRGQGHLQLAVLVCVGLLVATRVTNVYVPLYYKYVVDALTGPRPRFPWREIAVYVALKLLQGGGVGSMGLLNNGRQLLWISVQQHSERAVQLELFAHLHRLSLRWHLSRSTGEVLRVMDRGTTSITSLLSYLLFQIFPTVADIVIAVVFFAATFGGWFALIVFTTMLMYLVSTAAITEWRTKYRRLANLLDNAQRARAVDALLNYETVKYHDAEQYELGRYGAAVAARQQADWQSLASLNLLNLVQSVAVGGGLLAGSLLCARQVSRGQFTVGDYVLFAAYMAQLHAPLNWFGTYYRMIQQNFIDMENMMDLLKEPEEIFDMPGAPDLQVKQGRLEFRNVCFHYQPERPILRGVSFAVEPGQTVAIVGPSGGGKSTIVRLLFRFFDVTDGRIMLDNQDLKWVTQRSLRRAVGVVPQDAVLFNDTLRHNLKYGRPSASDADMEAAALAANIHDWAASIPSGYDALVGERGLKLSGGERQRVAIARALLKSPRFLLLDEATSALDSTAERVVQAALERLRAGRTTLVVAHRLSTITHADQILVLREGRVAERGSHLELLAKGGLYCSMWRQQAEAAERRRGGSRSPERRQPNSGSPERSSGSPDRRQDGNRSPERPAANDVETRRSGEASDSAAPNSTGTGGGAPASATTEGNANLRNVLT